MTSAREQSKMLSFAIKDEYFIVTPDNYQELFVKIHNEVGTGMDSNMVITEIAMCIRFKFTTLGPFTLASMGDYWDMRFIRVLDGHGYLRLASRNYLFVNPTMILPNEWSHFCFSFSNNKLLMVMNGILMFDDLNNLPDLIFTVQDLKNNGLILGLRQVLINDPKESNLRLVFHGDMSEFFMWSKALTLDDMVRITKDCVNAKTSLGSGLKPDIFDSETTDWTSYTTPYVALQNVTRSAMCKPVKDPDLTFLPFSLNFKEASLVCDANGGTLWYPRNETDLDYGIQLAKSFKSDPLKNVCTGLWINANKVHDDLYRTLEGQDITYLKWEDGQPNGRGFESCIAIMEGN